MIIVQGIVVNTRIVFLIGYVVHMDYVCGGNIIKNEPCVNKVKKTGTLSALVD